MKKIDFAAIDAAKHDKDRITHEGQELGKRMAHLADIGAKKFLDDDGEKDARCKTCAYSVGTVPNGCGITQMDAFKAMVEGEIVFNCHCKDMNGELPICAGFKYAKAGMRIQNPNFKPFKCEHEYSHITGVTK